jgi:hypothetical protein
MRFARVSRCPTRCCILRKVQPLSVEDDNLGGRQCPNDVSKQKCRRHALFGASMASDSGDKGAFQGTVIMTLVQRSLCTECVIEIIHVP